MLRLFSPAKLNLSLSLIGKRPDGFHELSSLFQTISLGDWMYIQPHAHDIISCSDSNVPLDASNLIFKALALFRRKTGLSLHLKVHLEKRIPMEAGLGGGSSNAATTLWACNQLAGQPVSERELQQWGAEIGSDISFFFSSGTAYCTGKGENVHSLPPEPVRSFIIVHPMIGMSTAEVFRHANPSHYSTMMRPGYYNDLEAIAFKLNPQLQKLKETLLINGFDQAVMTGSGSCFFCTGNGVIPLQCKSYPVSTINRMPEGWYHEKT